MADTETGCVLVSTVKGLAVAETVFSYCLICNRYMEVPFPALCADCEKTAVFCRGCQHYRSCVARMGNRCNFFEQPVASQEPTMVQKTMEMFRRKYSREGRGPTR